MTLARLLCCTTALALAACATPGRAHEPTTPTPTPSYRLCADPAFESMCAPPSVAAPVDAIRVDTNLATPPAPRSSYAA